MGTEMEPTEIFKISFKHLLKKHDVSQVKIADHIGVSPRSVNDYFGSRVNYSEQRRQKIANYFDMTYLEMLNLGHQLATGSEPVSPEAPLSHSEVSAKIKKLDQKDLKIINDMASRLAEKGQHE